MPPVQHFGRPAIMDLARERHDNQSRLIKGATEIDSVTDEMKRQTAWRRHSFRYVLDHVSSAVRGRSDVAIWNLRRRGRLIRVREVAITGNPSNQPARQEDQPQKQEGSERSMAAAGEPRVEESSPV